MTGHGLARMDDRSDPLADLTPACEAVQRAFACYDVGPLAVVTLAVEPPGAGPAPAFFVLRRPDPTGDAADSVLWPAECGPPMVVLRVGWGAERPPVCVTVWAGDAGGRLGDPAEYCLPQPVVCEDGTLCEDAGGAGGGAADAGADDPAGGDAGCGAGGRRAPAAVPGELLVLLAAAACVRAAAARGRAASRRG